MKKLIWSKVKKQHKICMITGILLSMVLFLSGCSLAREDADEEESVNTDRLVGVVITTEHIDLFDVEAFVNDNINEIANEDDLKSNTSEYNGRSYATIDKHGSEDPLEWEIFFEGIDGINFIDVTWRDEKEELFSMISVGDEIGDIKRHFSATDEGDSIELVGTLYLLLEEATEEVILYLNPVYQTTEGELYVTPGNGFSVSGALGVGASMTIDSQTSTEVTDETGNGTIQTYGASVQVNTEVFHSKPSVIRFHYMDDNLAILNTEEFEPGKVSEQVIAEEGSVCVIVETEWADGTVTREFIDLEKDSGIFVETFFMKNEKSLTKHSTEIIRK